MRSAGYKGFSITEMLITLAIGLIVLGVVITTIVTSFQMFSNTKRQLFRVVEQRKAYSHINKYIMASAYGVVSDMTGEGTFGKTLKLYGSDGTLLSTYTNLVVTSGSSVENDLQWTDGMKTMTFSGVEALFSKVKPVSGTDAKEVNVKFKNPVLSQSHVKAKLDTLSPPCECVEMALGGTGKGYASNMISHSWSKLILNLWQTINSHNGVQATMDASGHCDGFILAGAAKVDRDNCWDLGLVRLDSNGDWVWGKKFYECWYSGATYAVQTHAASGVRNGYIACGTSIWNPYPLNDWDSYVIKVDTNGNEIWRDKQYTIDFDVACGLTASIKEVYDPNGVPLSYFAVGNYGDCDFSAPFDGYHDCGREYGTPYDSQYWVLSYNTTGSLISGNSCIPGKDGASPTCGIWGFHSFYQHAYHAFQVVDPTTGLWGSEMVVYGSASNESSFSATWVIKTTLDGAWTGQYAFLPLTIPIDLDDGLPAFPGWHGAEQVRANRGGLGTGFIFTSAFMPVRNGFSQALITRTDTNFGLIWEYFIPLSGPGVISEGPNAVCQVFAAGGSADGFAVGSTLEVTMGVPGNELSILKLTNDGAVSWRNIFTRTDDCGIVSMLYNIYQCIDYTGEPDGYYTGGFMNGLYQGFYICKTDIYGNCPEARDPERVRNTIE